MRGLNFRHRAVDNAGVDQVSRPMQIALVAVVLLAGMWFTVLKPKPVEETAVTPATPAPTATTSAPVAPGVKGLTKAVDKAKAAGSTSDAANAKVQSATGGSTAKPKATKSVATPKKTLTATPAKAKAKAPAAKAKAKAPAAAKVDPSDRLLAFLAKGKTLVILFEGKGADDKAARKAVHLTAKADPKHVISAYVPVSKVGDYEKITTGVQIYGSPSILVIGKDRKATLLSGFVDAPSVQQAVGDARREAAGAKSAAKK
jgi:hypothetical protein